MARFNQLTLRIALTGLLLSGAAKAIAADRSRASSSATLAASRTPPLRLDAPRWAPLTGQQIAALFKGHSLIVDENYEPVPGVKVEIFEVGGCWPRENFFADGRWQRFECQRAARTYDGHWTTEAFRGGERLCVQASDFLKRCRLVWRGKSADQIIMPVAGVHARDDWDDPDAYNPYRLVKL